MQGSELFPGWERALKGLLTAVSHHLADFTAVWPKVTQLCWSRDGPEHEKPVGTEGRVCTACWCPQGPDMLQQSRKHCHHPRVFFHVSSTSNTSLSLYGARRSRISLCLQLEGCIAGLWAPNPSVDSKLQYYCSRQPYNLSATQLDFKMLHSATFLWNAGGSISLPSLCYGSLLRTRISALDLFRWSSFRSTRCQHSVLCKKIPGLLHPNRKNFVDSPAGDWVSGPSGKVGLIPGVFYVPDKSCSNCAVPRLESQI